MRVSSAITLVLLLSSLAAFIAQLLIDFTTLNIAASCIVLVTSILISVYIARTNAIHTEPVSTFAIFGFAMTTQVGAMLIQSLAWSSLSNGLRQPVETFATLFMYLIVALVAHSFFRVLMKNKKSTKASYLEKLKLYEVPSSRMLWIMGWFGVLAIFFGYRDDVVSKIWAGFRLFIYAPFLVPIYIGLIGESYVNNKTREYFFLINWLVLLILFGILLSMRSIIFTGVMVTSLFYLLAALQSNLIVKSKQVFRLSLFFVLIFAIAGPASDLATSIQIARNSQGNRFVNTIKAFQDPSAIEKYKASNIIARSYSAYDEAYIDNTILQRLVETKFHDNALYFSSNLTENNKIILADKTIDFLYGLLPQPMLDFLKIDVDKINLRYSMGDTLANLARGIPLGGYRTGSAFAQGQALFGLLFIPFYFMICMAIFYIMNLLTKKTATGVLVSAPALLLIWNFFQTGIAGESLHSMLGSIFRNHIQFVLLYLILYWIFRIFNITNVIKKNNKLIGKF